MRPRRAPHGQGPATAASGRRVSLSRHSAVSAFPARWPLACFRQACCSAGRAAGATRIRPAAKALRGGLPDAAHRRLRLGFIDLGLLSSSSPISRASGRGRRRRRGGCRPSGPSAAATS